MMNYLLFQAVERAAERAPDHAAVRFSGAEISYGELVRRSNGLAHALIAEGVGRGDRVGIFMNKCLESPVAIYGIMKAGAAYVPLDPFAPAARIARIIRDCAVHHLVTTDVKLQQSGLLEEELPPGLRLIRVAGIGDRGSGIDSPPALNLTEGDLAYILYTSGSTGVPKGIVHTHRSALSFAEWGAATYELTADDRVSNHAPLHFDLSTFDFFAAAQAGATTIIVPEATARLPRDLGRLIERERISVWYSVPFALVELLERGNLASLELPALRWVLFAGEVFPVKHLRRVLAALPRARFANLFGPTETNVCTYYNLPPELPASDEPIPIGVACGNVEALVVDEDGTPVADGQPGELLIRGGVVMRGYWGRRDLNERSFSRRPIAGGGFEADFYRTGDLVEAMPDGNFKYLGRKDRQIKTRGYRVELDEVEAAMVSLDLVEEAAAFAVPDGQGSHRIEAAVTAKEGAALSQELVLDHVARQLPPYAVPVTIRVVGAFPRTSTGKIDRRELARAV